MKKKGHQQISEHEDEEQGLNRNTQQLSLGNSQHSNTDAESLIIGICILVGLALVIWLLYALFYSKPQIIQATQEVQKREPSIYDILAKRLDITKRWLELKNPGHDDLAKEQYDYFEGKYNISQYSELPFCIVITSYNNMPDQRYKKNLDALIMQNYSNYRAVVYEDVSTDGTGAALDKYMEEHPKFKSKITIIHNKIRTTSMNNLRRGAMQFCKPQQIYMLYDGDDELIGRQTLKVFNAFYHQTKAWFVYSTTLLSTGWVGYSQPYPPQIIKQNSYRKFTQFRAQHCKTYYTQLFRLVKDQDLRDDDGDYYKYTSDQAICLPMLEMAHQKIAFITQMTYMYNKSTGINDGDFHAKQQQQIQKKVRNRTPYQPINSLKLPQQNK